MMFAFAFTEFHPAALAPTDFASARQAGSFASLHLTSCANWQAGDHNTHDVHERQHCNFILTNDRN
jgi:hypothetical protein